MVKGCLHVGLMMKSQGLKLKRYLLVLLLIHGQREQEGCVSWVVASGNGNKQMNPFCTLALCLNSKKRGSH
jgi:hypothetical protein